MSATLVTPKTTSGGEIVRELVNSSDGQGLHFDGAAASVAFTPVDLGTKFSFEFVVKADSLSGAANANYLAAFQGGGNAILGHDNGTLKFYSVGAWYDFGVNPLNDLKVHHLTMTVDGTSATIFDNANQIATATIATSNIDSATTAGLGANAAGTSGFFDGTIYRARFYNRTLSADDVRTAYQRADVDFSSQYGSQTELVTNGTFATDSNWTKGTGWSIGSGVASSDGSQTGNSEIYQSVSFTAGKRYRLSFEVTAFTSGQVRFLLGSGGTGGTWRSATGTYVEEFVADSASTSNLHIQANSTFVGSIDNVSFKAIGCVSDYQTQWANPSQSLTVQDASGNADGTCSASGVTQVQPVVQLNSTSARIGTTAATPADGDIIADKVGAGIAPAAPLHAKTPASTGTSPLEVARLEVKDEGLNMNAGMGPKLTFYTPHTDASFEGASIAAKKEDAGDYNEATALVFSTCPDAGTNTERVNINSTGQVTVNETAGSATNSTKLEVRSDADGSTSAIRTTNKDTTAGTNQAAGIDFGLSRNSGAFKPQAGQIKVGREADWDASDTNIDSYMAFSTYGNNALGERLRIDSSGKTTADALKVLDPTHGRYFDFVLDSSASYLDVSHALNLRVNGASSLATAITISSAGDVTVNESVAIGTTPTAGISLNVRENSTTTAADIRNANASGFGLYVAGGSSSSQYAFRAANKDNDALFTVRGDGLAEFSGDTKLGNGLVSNYVTHVAGLDDTVAISFTFPSQSSRYIHQMLELRVAMGDDGASTATPTFLRYAFTTLTTASGITQMDASLGTGITASTGASGTTFTVTLTEGSAIAMDSVTVFATVTSGHTDAKCTGMTVA